MRSNDGSNKVATPLKEELQAFFFSFKSIVFSQMLEKKLRDEHLNAPVLFAEERVLVRLIPQKLLNSRRKLRPSMIRVAA